MTSLQSQVNGRAQIGSGERTVASSRVRSLTVENVVGERRVGGGAIALYQCVREGRPTGRIAYSHNHLSADVLELANSLEFIVHETHRHIHNCGRPIKPSHETMCT